MVVAEGVAGPGRDLDVDSYVSISNLDARKTVLSAGPERGLVGLRPLAGLPLGDSLSLRIRRAGEGGWTAYNPPRS